MWVSFKGGERVMCTSLDAQAAQQVSMTSTPTCIPERNWYQSDAGACFRRRVASARVRSPLKKRRAKRERIISLISSSSGCCWCMMDIVIFVWSTSKQSWADNFSGGAADTDRRSRLRLLLSGVVWYWRAPWCFLLCGSQIQPIYWTFWLSSQILCL